METTTASILENLSTVDWSSNNGSLSDTNDGPKEDEWKIVSVVILAELLGVAVLVFCCLAIRKFHLCQFVTNNKWLQRHVMLTVAPTNLESIFIVGENSQAEPPPAYESQVGPKCETPPPSFDSLFTPIETIQTDEDNKTKCAEENEFQQNVSYGLPDNYLYNFL